MKLYLALLLVLCLSACHGPDFPPANGTACQSPFANLATSSASADDLTVLREASEDFCAVVAGKFPIHAKFDQPAPLPSDGGTTFYVGRKYKLTVLNSLSSFGTYHGTAHGPILSFDESFAAGNTREISSIRVYPKDTR